MYQLTFYKCLAYLIFGTPHIGPKDYPTGRTAHYSYFNIVATTQRSNMHLTGIKASAQVHSRAEIYEANLVISQSICWLQVLLALANCSVIPTTPSPVLYAFVVRSMSNTWVG